MKRKLTAQEKEWAKQDAADDKAYRALLAAKTAYYAFPEEYRDECVDRENAQDYKETTAIFWEVMLNSAESRRDCA
jgi:hypothetical protein